MRLARSLVLLALPLGVLFGCGGAAPPAEGPGASAPGETPPPESPPVDGDNPESPPPPPPKEKAPNDAKDDAKKEADKPSPPGQAAADTALGGKLSQKDIQTIVLKNGDLFNECYSLGAGKGQQFVATVTIKATIGPKGTVNEARVQKSTAKNPKVDQCVADAFKKIQFPVPKDGATSVIFFPMEFGGAEQVK